MSIVQRFFMGILPKRWADDMRAESEAWRIRCCTCGASRSIWDAGGIRWRARSMGKRTLIQCGRCGRTCAAAIEKAPS